MFSKQKQASGNSVQSRLAQLRGDFGRLQKDIGALADNLGDSANDKYRDTLHAAEGLAERAFTLAEDSAGHVNEIATRGADGVEAWAVDRAGDLRETVRAQPLQTLALTLGIGALLGAFLVRR